MADRSRRFRETIPPITITRFEGALVEMEGVDPVIFARALPATRNRDGDLRTHIRRRTLEGGYPQQPRTSRNVGYDLEPRRQEGGRQYSDPYYNNPPNRPISPPYIGNLQRYSGGNASQSRPYNTSSRGHIRSRSDASRLYHFTLSDLESSHSESSFQAGSREHTRDSPRVRTSNANSDTREVDINLGVEFLLDMLEGLSIQNHESSNANREVRGVQLDRRSGASHQSQNPRQSNLIPPNQSGSSNAGPREQNLGRNPSQSLRPPTENLGRGEADQGYESDNQSHCSFHSAVKYQNESQPLAAEHQNESRPSIGPPEQGAARTLEALIQEPFDERVARREAELEGRYGLW